MNSTCSRELGLPSCPITVDTIGKMMEYQLDNEMFLYEFKKVVEMIVGDRFLRVHCIAFIIYVCVSFTSLLMG